MCAHQLEVMRMSIMQNLHIIWPDFAEVILDNASRWNVKHHILENCLRMSVKDCRIFWCKFLSDPDPSLHLRVELSIVIEPILAAW